MLICDKHAAKICTLNTVKVPYSNENKQKILTLRHCQPIVCSELGGNTKWLKKGRVFIFDIWQLCEYGIVSYDSTALSFAQWSCLWMIIKKGGCYKMSLHGIVAWFCLQPVRCCFTVHICIALGPFAHKTSFFYLKS